MKQLIQCWYILIDQTQTMYKNLKRGSAITGCWDRHSAVHLGFELQLVSLFFVFVLFLFSCGLLTMEWWSMITEIIFVFYWSEINIYKQINLRNFMYPGSIILGLQRLLYYLLSMGICACMHIPSFTRSARSSVQYQKTDCCNISILEGNRVEASKKHKNRSGSHMIWSRSCGLSPYASSEYCVLARIITPFERME